MLSIMLGQVINNKFKGILFDHDGVLVSSEHLHFEAWKEMLKGLGINIQDSHFNQMVGRPAPKIMESLLDEFRPGWKPEDYDIDALALRKNDIYLKLAQQGLAAYPGVIEGLKKLKSKGIKCGVVSNAKRRELVFSVERLKLSEYFDVVLSRDDVTRPKPDPIAFESGALQLGLLPSECLAIDDSPTGLHSALLAGIPCVSITSSYPEHYLTKPVPGRPDLKPFKIFGSMTEFFLWLEDHT
jgi:beta-phosphoglucomutase